MIRIYIDRFPELQTWYADQMTPLIFQKPVQSSSIIGANSCLGGLSQTVAALPERSIRDILLTPMDDLCRQYTWIQEYVMLCDVTASYPVFRKRHPGHGNSGVRALYIEQYCDCKIFQEAFQDTGISHEASIRSWKKLGIVIKKAQKKLQSLNGIIEQKFNYSFLTDEIRGELAERMGIPVCPYCNRQYIQPVTIDGKKRYLGDLDHILPKSLYALFSMSLWNSTPSCKVCNQMFKKDKGLPVLNPQERGFDEDCIFTLEYNNVCEIVGLQPPTGMQWEIQPSADAATKNLLENNLNVFRLNEVYDYHRRDVQRALQRRYRKESIGYFWSLKRLPLDLDDPWLWYGVSLEPSKFQEELLSKMIYDTVLYN